MQRLIRPGDLVFDVGANTGEKSAAYLAWGARVVCVEPQPDCARMLRERFGQRPDVAIHQAGLAATKGVLTLHLCSDDHRLSTFAADWKHGRFASRQWNGTLSVPVTTLDHLIGEYGAPAYCKIDVEGFEEEVLAGLSRPVPCLSFEFAREFLNKTERCVAYLEQLGYSDFNLVLGEGERLHLPQWCSSGQLFAEIEKSDDAFLWGDVYARHAPRPERKSATRHPTKNDSIAKLKEMGVPVGTVLDVGVQTCTPELLNAFRDQHHVLMEPIAEFESRIAQIYGEAGVSHEIVSAAISDEDGMVTMKTSTLFPDRPLSHARIVGETRDGWGTRRVACRTLDAVVAARELAKPYLLKIDVDGAEAAVVAGGTATLRDCSVVIIEAGVATVVDRSEKLQSAGFQLFDIVDLSYYNERLVQADLVFVNSNVLKMKGLEPHRRPFDISRWAAYRPDEAV